MKHTILICFTIWLIATEYLVVESWQFALRIELTARALHIVEPLAPVTPHKPGFENL
jgi:hypothetical protein